MVHVSSASPRPAPSAADLEKIALRGGLSRIFGRILWGTALAEDNITERAVHERERRLAAEQRAVAGAEERGRISAEMGRRMVPVLLHQTPGAGEMGADAVPLGWDAGMVRVASDDKLAGPTLAGIGSALKGGISRLGAGVNRIAETAGDRAASAVKALPGKLLGSAPIKPTVGSAGVNLANAPKGVSFSASPTSGSYGRVEAAGTPRGQSFPVGQRAAGPGVFAAPAGKPRNPMLGPGPAPAAAAPTAPTTPVAPAAKSPAPAPVATPAATPAARPAPSTSGIAATPIAKPSAPVVSGTPGASRTTGTQPVTPAPAPGAAPGTGTPYRDPAPAGAAAPVPAGPTPGTAGTPTVTMGDPAGAGGGALDKLKELYTSGRLPGQLAGAAALGAGAYGLYRGAKAVGSYLNRDPGAEVHGAGHPQIPQGLNAYGEPGGIAGY